MSLKSLIVEIAQAVVAHNKKKVREGRLDSIDCYAQQKKFLWYTLMSAVDADQDAEDAARAAEKKRQP